jgi:hypothetical protein
VLADNRVPDSRELAAKPLHAIYGTCASEPHTAGTHVQPAYLHRLEAGRINWLLNRVVEVHDSSICTDVVVPSA